MISSSIIGKDLEAVKLNGCLSLNDIEHMNKLQNENLKPVVTVTILYSFYCVKYTLYSLFAKVIRNVPTFNAPTDCLSTDKVGTCLDVGERASIAVTARRFLVSVPGESFDMISVLNL